MKNQKGVRNKTNKYILVGSTVSSALIAAHSVIPAVVFAANQYTWTRQDEIDTSEGSPTMTAMSANGSHLILGGEGNMGLYISDDSGATWENIDEEIDPGVQNDWAAVDVSNDGQTMVAASEEGLDIQNEIWLDGRIFVSKDGGDTWDNISPEGDDWETLVVSGDGSTIAVGGWDSGNVYITENDGADWTTKEYAEGAWNVKNLAISDNGNKILLGGENGEDPYTHVVISEDSGDTWSEIDPDVEDEIHTMALAMSSNGSTIAVGTTGYNGGDNDSIFVSQDDGENWTDITPDDDLTATWRELDMSDDASTLVAIDDSNQKLYISENLGTDWAEENPSEAYDEISEWVAADINTDGTKFIVASDDYAYLNYSAETENVVTLDNAVGGKTIAITTPEGTTITCHSAAAESELDVTDTSYTYPLGLVDFCFSGADTNNEVTLVFVTNLKPNEVVARKYNPTTKQYTTINEATITETTYEGQHALQVTYNITDNGPLDLDPDTGEVSDPVGLAVTDNEEALADTGENTNSTALVAVALLVIGFSFLARQQLAKRKAK